MVPSKADVHLLAMPAQGQSPVGLLAYCLLLLCRGDLPCKCALTNSEGVDATKHIENICMWMVKMDVSFTNITETGN